MVKTSIASLLCIFILSGFAHAQNHNESSDTNELYDTYNKKPQKPKTSFIGFHGYFITSGEIFQMQTDLFEELISNENIPTVELKPGLYLSNLSFMRNWMFTSLSFSYRFGDTKQKDSLVSELSQYSLAARFGYNILKKNYIVVSPYIGLRYSWFNHITSLRDEELTLDQYLQVREIDLSVSQFSGEIGVNSSFLIMDMWSVGVYAGYLINFFNNPRISANGSRITNRINNPIGNFVIGLGFGMGGNYFN